MNDTAEPVARMQQDRHAAMTPEERMRITSSMYATARAIVVSSLPEDSTPEQVRYAIARRFYGDELSDTALVAYAVKGAAITENR